MEEIEEGGVDSSQDSLKNEVPSPIAFLRQIRTKLLGNSPTPESVDAFNNTLQGRALVALEKHYQVVDEKERTPLLRVLRYDLHSNTYFLNDPKQKKLGLEVPMNMTLFIDENGVVELGTIYDGGEGFLPKVAKKVTIDGKSGKVTPFLNAKYLNRTRLILDEIGEYSDRVKAVFPLAQQYKENLGQVPSILTPRFGWEGMRTLRGDSSPNTIPY